jgi:hypothetical protein
MGPSSSFSVNVLRMGLWGCFTWNLQIFVAFRLFFSYSEWYENATDHIGGRFCAYMSVIYVHRLSDISNRA